MWSLVWGPMMRLVSLEEQKEKLEHFLSVTWVIRWPSSGTFILNFPASETEERSVVEAVHSMVFCLAAWVTTTIFLLCQHFPYHCITPSFPKGFPVTLTFLSTGKKKGTGKAQSVPLRQTAHNTAPCVPPARSWSRDHSQSKGSERI